MASRTTTMALASKFGRATVGAVISLSCLAGFADAQEPAPSPDDAAGPQEPAAQGEERFLLWSDSSLSLLPWGDGFEVDPPEQATLTFEHAHESTIGDTFLFVDYTRFLHQDGDDTTWYAEIGPRMSFGKVFNRDLSRTLFKKSVFEIKDVLLAMNYERGEDADIAEAVLLGIGLDLDVREAGLLAGLDKFNYVQLNFYGRAEMIDGAESGFRDAQITMVASYPFRIGQSQFLVDGYFDWVLGIGNEDGNFHVNPQLTMDLGAIRDKPGKLFVGIELDFWWNKYQIVNSPAFDTNQSALSLLIKYHL